MREGLTKWINEWAIEDNDNSYRLIHQQANFLAKALFHDYQPTQVNSPDFLTRLENWINNLEEIKDRKTLVRLFSSLIYIGRKEYDALCRVAYNKHIAQWLIDIDNISLDNLADAKVNLDRAIRTCWICPVTDSFDINSFFHLNNIPSTDGNEKRPYWYKLEENGDIQWNLHHQHIKDNFIGKLILLEDFVGSGSQIGGTLEFVLKKTPDIDILLIPIINCPKGIEHFKELAEKYPRFTYKAVIEPSAELFISKEASEGEADQYSIFRELLIRSYNQVSGGKAPFTNIKPYSPFGYRDTGGLIVRFANTPDNTVPIIHYNSNQWDSLFPRHSRN